MITRIGQQERVLVLLDTQYPWTCFHDTRHHDMLKYPKIV
jgi:hypothetical protein